MRIKHYISYKPYGEILRTDSGGPDITKFKYTGQIEDKETGLMYYKARYYDPMVARFTQADSMVFNDQVSGMNRYMYVSGNPVKYRDPSGHKPNHFRNAIIGYMLAPAFGISREEGAMIGFSARNKNVSRAVKGALMGYVFGERFGLTKEQGAAIGFGLGKKQDQRAKRNLDFQKGFDNAYKTTIKGFSENWNQYRDSMAKMGGWQIFQIFFGVGLIALGVIFIATPWGYPLIVAGVATIGNAFGGENPYGGDAPSYQPN